MKSLKLICLVLPALFVLSSLDIVRRHDKSDKEYLELGAQFKSVGKVGKRGGDGTLVASQWVVTAAHVAKGMWQREGADMKVYFENLPEGVLVEKVFVHPSFKPMRGADVALLLLKEEVKSITPAQFYTSKDEVGSEIIIVGHGDARTGKGGEWLVDGKRRAATNLIDAVSDDKIIFDFDEPGEGTKLEGTAGPGDSGGPAFIVIDNQPMIAGISSAGMPGKNGPGTYGAKEFYTRVSTYRDWINTTMQNPDDRQTLSKESAQREESGQRRVVTGRPQGGPIAGLGLFLMQEGDRIRIGGKADPRVPKEFRHVMFKPPSFIDTFSDKQYTSLEEFLSDFKKLKPGDEFSIQFNIQGEKMSFKAKKM